MAAGNTELGVLTVPITLQSYLVFAFLSRRCRRPYLLFFLLFHFILKQRERPAAAQFFFLVFARVIRAAHHLSIYFSSLSLSLSPSVEYRFLLAIRVKGVVSG